MSGATIVVMPCDPSHQSEATGELASRFRKLSPSVSVSLAPSSSGRKERRLRKGEPASQDTLYEDWLSYGMDGRYDVDKWFHDRPYRLLINSFYRDSEEESIRDVTAYLDAWYPAMKEARWHDGHLKANEQKGGAYVGYWAIEVAAAAYLLEVDDTSFRNHPLYPKDLTNFARAFEVRQKSQSVEAGAGPLTVRTGLICPETGSWNAVGHNVPGVMVRQGEVMPDVYVPDARGTLKPTPATWTFERKA
ncbi:PoNe immunity protein domain-containing protein [Paraburkholderia tropica]|uniref:PoNe immunity protein domain-containing protein n=1 Tax=Paraburkholderia tropica TaxID=92647 RepID=UPI001E2BFDE4|nr:PoNe immunity protein domain-containing protein [Paraburkholderia tropica]